MRCTIYCEVSPTIKRELESRAFRTRRTQASIVTQALEEHFARWRDLEPAGEATSGADAGEGSDHG